MKGRCAGKGCPVCAGMVLAAGVNDLVATDPDVAAQWHPTKNAPLTPKDVFAGTRRKVWWLCEKGHEWEAAVDSRTGGRKTGCPVCAGKTVIPGENDLMTAFPELAREWDREKNGSLQPDTVTPYANIKAW